MPRPGPFFAADIGPGLVTQGDGWGATAVRVKHLPWLQSLAYGVDSLEGSIVFTGDNGPSEDLDKLAKGADTLVVNVWDQQETYAPGEDDVIAGTIDAATLARDAGVRRLIITHAAPTMARPGSRERAIGDMAGLYPGEIIFGEELMGLEL